MSTLTTSGFTTVEAPTLTPSEGGLFGAAQVVPLAPHETMGVQYESILSGLAHQITETGTDCISAALDPNLNEGFSWTESGSAFFVYTAVECLGMGNQIGEFESIAKARLTAGSERGVEAHVWTETFATATDLNPAGALSPVAGLALLKQYAASNYDFVPTFHLGEELAVSFTADRLMDFDRTLPGRRSKVADGAGYVSLTGPGGTVAAAGQAWLYVTGEVVVRQGPVTTHSAFDTPTNAMLAIAVRPYVVTIDDFAVAVRITLES